MGFMDKELQVGAAKVRLDDRGRLAVPNRFRDILRNSGDFVLTSHPHGCLAVYSIARFDSISAQFRERSNMSYFDSHLEELVIGSAEKLLLDSADRFLIGGHLRTYAAIERDVRLFNLPDTMRIWGEERWEQKHALMMARLQDADMTTTWKELRL